MKLTVNKVVQSSFCPEVYCRVHVLPVHGKCTIGRYLINLLEFSSEVVQFDKHVYLIFSDPPCSFCFDAVHSEPGD